MKIFSAILSFYILLLTAVPVMPMIVNKYEKGHCKMKCCMMKDAKTKDCSPKKKQSKGCEGDACNPFMSCCNCYALIKHQQHFSAPFIYAEQKFNATIENSDSNFLSDAWHPPQAA